MSKSRKTLQNGRSAHDRFVALTHNMLDHPSWKSLSSPGKCIFIELMRRYNGHNNGEISLSIREAAKAGGCGSGKASSALEQLRALGFVEIHNKGVYRNRHASTWILTNQEYKGAKSNKWRHPNLIEKKAEIPAEHAKRPYDNTVVPIQIQPTTDSRCVDTVSGSEKAKSAS